MRHDQTDKTDIDFPRNRITLPIGYCADFRKTLYEKACLLFQTIGLIFLSLAAVSFVAAQTPIDIGAATRPGHVLILTEDGYAPSLRTLFPDISFSDLKSYDRWHIRKLTDACGYQTPETKSAGNALLANLYVLDFPDTVDVRQVLSRLAGTPGLRYAEPDYRLQLFSWPSDSLFNQQWYLNNTGQGFYAIERNIGDSNDVLYIRYGKPGEDIRLAPVYEDPPADSVEVLVAIIDTGIDYLHPDLTGTIAANPWEIPDNSVDDDHNGLVDDSRGWDFSGDTVNVLDITGDNDATDSIGHGTHVAGLVAAAQNSQGIAGFPGRIRILPIKIFPNGFQSITVAAIIYAADMGAKVINISWGFTFDSKIMREALLYAVDRGCLPVAAAGNFGNSEPTYPASFPETFAVGGTEPDGAMTFFSTYGPFIDIVAPGRDILSLRAAGTDLYAPGEPNVRIIAGNYILADGTSMSAPLVAGTAAMLWSFNPGLQPDHIREVLRQSADDVLDPWGDGLYLPGYDTISGWGRLNAGRALEMVMAPAAYLTAPLDNAVLSGAVAVRITVTGGYSGPVDLFYGEGKTPASWTFLSHRDSADGIDTLHIWSPDGLAGYYSFRLEAGDAVDQVTVRLVDGTVVEIVSPGEEETVKYLVPVRAIAYGSDYDSAVLSYRPEGVDQYKRLHGSTSLFFDESFYDWPLYSLSEGSYRLRLEAFAGLSRVSDSVTVYALSAMRAGFPVYMNGYVAVSPGTADIDGDGFKEIVVGCQKGLYAYNHDGSLLDGFPILPNMDMRSMPAFDDVDGDGLQDIIAIGPNIIGCFNYRGEPLPGWTKTASTGMTFSSYPIPVPAELYDRDDSVIIYMSKYGEINAYRYNGDPYFYSLGGLFTALDPNIFDTSLFAGLTLPYVTAADLENNGSIEVVSLYSTMYPLSGIYIWNARNGLPAFGWDTPRARKIRLSYGGMLADVDEDGTLEVVASVLDTNSVTSVIVAKRGREDLPGWPVQITGLSDWMGTAPVCADVDGNGAKEIFVAFYYYDIARIYAFNRDGTPYVVNPALPYGMLLSTSNTLSNLIIADINGDGIPNLISRGGYIFPNTGYERVFAWEPNGDPTPGYPIVTPTPPNEVVSTPLTPLVDDLDNDGTTELIMAGDNRNLFVWNLDVPFDSAAMLWPKLLGDVKNSGINRHRGLPTGVDPVAVNTPGRFGISSNHPNPFNPTTTILFSLDRSGDVELEIFNILGQKVTALLSGRYQPGAYSCQWDGTDSEGAPVASGVYFARLTSAEKQSTRKMLLLR